MARVDTLWDPELVKDPTAHLTTHPPATDTRAGGTAFSYSGIIIDDTSPHLLGLSGFTRFIESL